MPNLVDDLVRWTAGLPARLDTLQVELRREAVGRIISLGDGVASIAGLPEAGQDELLILGDGVAGMAVTLDEDVVGAVLLGDWAGLSAGAPVRGTGQVVRVPVGEALLGRVVDSLGRPLDGDRPLPVSEYWPIERPAPGIVDRALISQPLATGITVIDAMIPVGRGQRELIIGDRKTGKTAVAVDAMVNQRDSDVICIYAAISQKSSSVNRVVDAIRARGAPDRTIVVVAEPDQPPGLAWLTPYAACTMAEYFAEQGRHVLVVYDDLTKHAAVHRQLSLLLRRPPGREAYPGDVFYLHSRLLERAAKLSAERGGGSLTALPIAETQAGNLSAYIPTNLISITDGQIYLEPKLFYEGQRPAVNVGLSVSRVGGKTQAPALKALSESLRLEYAQFLELEVFTRFGGMIDERTRRIVEHGRRIRAMLIQRPLEPLPLSEQVAGLLALADGRLDPLPMEAVERFKAGLGPRLAADLGELTLRLDADGVLSDDGRAEMRTVVEGLLRDLGG
ncbi:F0F1 ATP synthase subunit alpha [Magnetospirillum sp. 15-1]|uniref:F0F1 ATP synthase subunit alpha n=1 Tax=Magnetospirillum sp. 15-1 TaxID=1979370 RepID=UPI000BBC406B|nr:F0F1 ATP synthase subunit alpha [Magnetospirillum sp. 15-1]